MSVTRTAASTRKAAAPWFRQLTPDQRKAFLAAYLGWLLDGFDFTILTFVLVDVQRSFTVNSALAGALGTVALMFRVVGGITAGTAADRWGRKGPLMCSIVWYSLFAFLSGFSTSYAMLFLCRALFGIGMGGVWAAGMPLAIEHWPPHLRGVASGLLQGGYAMGYILSATVYQFGYPLVSNRPDGWRMLMWGHPAGTARRMDLGLREGKPRMARASPTSSSLARHGARVPRPAVRARPSGRHHPYLPADGVAAFSVQLDHVLEES